MRAIGIDVHRDFCEVAISEGGRLRSADRVSSTPEELELLGASLSSDDVVAWEATGNALAIARIIEPHVARVVVASARELHAISDAKAKTDRRDARTLAKLLAAGMLEGTWLPGEEVRTPAPPPGPARPARAGAQPPQERGPSGPHAQPRRRTGGDGPLRSSWTSLA